MRFPFPMTDEMRELWPGAMIGKSSVDPTFGKRKGKGPNGPLMSNFIFFQVRVFGWVQGGAVCQALMRGSGDGQHGTQHGAGTLTADE